ncbi:MAG: phage protease [Puniceicoccales bacterium]|jgi:hypothetical protein|nr:phage protease [Puniceicoccales bacterium]
MEWIKLVNFGEYQHSKGIQLFDERAANAIVEYFHSLRGRLMRKFHGIPIFIGHPDDPEFSSRNGKVYGRVEDLKVEDDALWILIKWTEIGRELFKNGIIRHLSPRWLTVRARDGKLFPKRLLSIGLTNHPNIPCEHTAKVEKFSEEIDGIALKNACGADSSEENAHRLDGADSSRQDGDADTAEQKKPHRSGIENCLPELHMVSRTEGLKQSTCEKSNCEKILELVYQRMQKFSEAYGDAWIAVKRSSPALFRKNF